MYSEQSIELDLFLKCLQIRPWQYSKSIKCDANVTCSKNSNSTHSFQLQYNFISGSK